MILLAAAFAAAGVVGLAAFSAALRAWLTTPGTSPLAALIALAWSSTFVATAFLTWRRSGVAPLALLAATALLLVVLSFLFPQGQILLFPLFVVTVLTALLGYRYLRRASEHAA